MKKFIPVSEPSITEKEIRYILDAVKSGWVSSLGKYIEKFEESFAQYIGVKYALTTSSGTAALHLALSTLNIKGGEEVIVPDLTFIATANAVTYTGARPVFADIDPETWCIDPADIENKIDKKTKAIIPVHLYGHSANMDEINKIANQYNLFVVEDAAEAHGTEYKNKKVGGLGDCGIFSFYGNKIITTGEGGMITTNNKRLYEKAKHLRDHAMSKTKRYWHTEVGYNYRMTNIQAALGLAQLERIEKLIRKKRQIFNWYKEFLSGIDDIILNPEKNWTNSVFWMVCLVLNNGSKISRDELMQKLKRKSIDSRPFFCLMSQLPMYAHKNIKNSVAQSLSLNGLNLPSSVKLNKNDVFYICKNIRKFIIKE